VKNILPELRAERGWTQVDLAGRLITVDWQADY